MTEILHLKNVRCGYPTLVRAKSVAGGRPRYGIVLYIDPESGEWQEILKAVDIVREEAAKKAGKSFDRILPPDFTPDESMPDHKAVRAYRAEETGQPAVAELLEDGRTLPHKDPQRIQGGDYVDVYLTVYAYYDKPSSGVTFGLEGVRFVREGERFGGGLTYDQMWGDSSAEGATPRQESASDDSYDGLI